MDSIFSRRPNYEIAEKEMVIDPIFWLLVTLPNKKPARWILLAATSGVFLYLVFATFLFFGVPIITLFNEAIN